MSNIDQDTIRQILLRTCAWCMRRIDPEEEIFGFGAKASPRVDLRGKENEFVTLDLSLNQKTVVALVVREGTPAKEAGYDLMFVTCSQSCAEELKQALELEMDVFEDTV